MNPRPLLHLEGAAVFALSLLAYHWSHGSWLLFVLLFLVPDLSMLGYVVNVRLGSLTYNTVHTYVGPLLLAAYAFGLGHQTLLWLSFIWIAHIGFDRTLGFGLKYPTRFKDTHLNPDRHPLGIGNPSFGKLWQDDKRIESSRQKTCKLIATTLFFGKYSKIRKSYNPPTNVLRRPVLYSGRRFVSGKGVGAKCQKGVPGL